MQLSISEKAVLSREFFDSAPPLVPRDLHDYTFEDVKERVTTLQQLAKRSRLFKQYFSCDNNYHENSCNLQKESLVIGDLLRALCSNGFALINDFMPGSDHKVFCNYCTAAEDIISRQPSLDNISDKPAFFGLHSVLAYADDMNRQTLDAAFRLWNMNYAIQIASLFKEITGIYFPPIPFAPQHLRCSVNEDRFHDRNTYWHIDRFIPVYKAFYFPLGSSQDLSPFSYAKGSQVIDDDYICQCSTAIYNSSRNNQMIGWNSMRYAYIDLDIKPNTLVIAATHGLHRRKISATSGWRHTFRALVYDKLTTRALLNCGS